MSQSTFYVPQILLTAKSTYPKCVALTTEIGEDRTYVQLHQRVCKAATGLRNVGLTVGGRAAIISLNHSNVYESYFSINWCGGLVVPLNIRLAPPEMIETLLDCNPEVVFVDDAFSALTPLLQQKIASLKQVVYLGLNTAPNGTVAYEKLIENSEPMGPHPAHGDDVYGLFYTGGTTGKSKGVMLTHTNLIFNSYGVLNAVRYNETSRYLHVAPMFHLADFASVFAVTSVGGRHTFIPRFLPKETLEAIERYGVTHTVMVPTMLAMVAQLPNAKDFNLSTMDTFVYGASAMPETILLSCLTLFPNAKFVQGYGMTECAPVNTFLSAECHVKGHPKLGSVGRSVVHAELKVVDENDNEVPVGEVGELCVRGPHVMKGYYNMPETTALAFRNGWMHTGDGALIDEDGYVFIKDRIKDMIVSGGENVYSTEVENCIQKMPTVAACAVIGTPDDSLVELVTAIVVPKENTEVTCDQVVAHCKSLIAGYKCPRLVIIRKEPLPLSGAGKVLKTDLRKPFWENASRKDIYAEKETTTAYDTAGGK
jgi:long-chain acyl-CoA synthetase